MVETTTLQDVLTERHVPMRISKPDWERYSDEPWIEGAVLWGIPNERGFFDSVYDGRGVSLGNTIRASQVEKVALTEAQWGKLFNVDESPYDPNNKFYASVTPGTAEGNEGYSFYTDIRTADGKYVGTNLRVESSTGE